MPITIMLCCNDYRNGEFLGYAENIEIDEVEMVGGRVAVRGGLEPPATSKPIEGEEGLRIGRIVVPCLSYKTWVGNWCWDAAQVRAVHALKIVNYLIAAKWHCEDGPYAQYEAVNKGLPISPDEWLRLLRSGNA